MSPLVLRPEEPAARPWERWPLARLADAVAAAGQPSAGPLMIAVDVHTDDVAWHHSFFDWADLLIEGVLERAATGRAVAFRPPAWEERGRPGAIEVPQGTRYLLVEGVGASRRELDSHLGTRLWVQSDFFAAEQRGVARDIAQGVNGNPAESFAFWHEWMAQEIVFLAADRPWERADLVVCGTPSPSLGPDDVLVAAPPTRGR